MTDKRFDDGPFLTLADYGAQAMNLAEAMPMIDALHRCITTEDDITFHGLPTGKRHCDALQRRLRDINGIVNATLDQYRVFLPPPTTKE